MPRILLIALLAFGTIAGFGSGFSSLAHRLHGGFSHGCHAPWSAWHRGFDPADAPTAPAPVAPAAPLAPAAVAPLTAAAPYPQPIIVLPQVAPPQATPPAQQQAPIHLNLTITPNGQVRASAQ
ncbi:MAG: hypothetical protein IRZ16_19695 [Myxococcaceae bacterium]|nr:hypothetical protein [Myxococcaceae bacterium]